MSILLYAGEGVSPTSLKHCLDGLKEVTDVPLKIVDSNYLANEPWEEESLLLLMPGGRDLPYHKDLQGIAIKRIRVFVEKGGSYLGICAGGYFGAKEIEFEKGGTLEVLGERDLAFFPGMAIGPAYGPNLFCYDSERGAKNAELLWKKKLVSAYFNGGCYFEGAEKFSDVKVLAKYSDIENKPAAIVKCRVGKGRAILTGVHIEFPKRSILWNEVISALLQV